MLVSLLVGVGIGYVVYRAFKELRAAYARGDISEEEFETHRERLRR